MSLSPPGTSSSPATIRAEGVSPAPFLTETQNSELCRASKLSLDEAGYVGATDQADNRETVIIEVDGKRLQVSVPSSLGVSATMGGARKP